MRQWLILIVLVGLLALIYEGAVYFKPTAIAVINEETYTLETADSPEERTKGLMNRESLCEKCGMLFVFEKKENHSFWTKNMKFPIEIIFLDSDFEVVQIFHAEPCAADPCTVYTPDRPSKFVIELNLGVLQNLSVGDKILINI